MDWKEYYRQRVVSAEEAVSHIKSGDWIFPSHGCFHCGANGPKPSSFDPGQRGDHSTHWNVLQRGDWSGK